MRVCIDGFNIALREGSGIATYARGLNVALRAMGFQTHILYGPADAPGRHNLLNEISLLDANPPATSAARRLTAGLAALLMPWTTVARRIERTGEVIDRQLEPNAPPCDVLWARRDVFHGANSTYAVFGRFSPVRLGAAPGADVMHWTCPLPIREPRIPNVYTIHDLVPLRLPFATLDVKRRFFSMCRQICRGADRIVTVSEHSKRDIMRVFGVAEHRIAVTYQSVEVPKAWLAQPDSVVADDIERIFELSWRGYFLFYGAIEPKKNLARVIEAYLASGVVAPLVIVGHGGWLNDEELRLLRSDPVNASPPRRGMNSNSGRIRRYDYLPSRLLVSLVRGAKATLMPSLYEGFGLPVLESIQLGTPVLASTAGALPEVAGDGALLVDPYDADAIRNAIRDLDADDDLRAALIARGAVQARRFSGEAYRGRLTDLYAAVA